jgi:hypothetical protein
MILSFLIIAMAMLAGACQPEPGSRVIKYSEDDVENWRTKEINLLDSDAPGAQGTRIFSAKMPIGCDIMHARPRTNFWSG